MANYLCKYKYLGERDGELYYSLLEVLVTLPLEEGQKPSPRPLVDSLVIWPIAS